MNSDAFTLKLMELGDIAEAARVLSIAMQNNPLHIAVLQGHGERQRAIIEKIFIDLFNTFPGITFVAREGRAIVGVMRMKSCCGARPADEPPRVSGEEAVDRRLAFWLQEWARHDPGRQHWHLGPLGVLPSHRGRGIGTALMNLFCREVDSCLATAFLETDSAENVRFYNKFGFTTVATSNIFNVESRYMARAAAGARNGGQNAEASGKEILLKE